MRHIWIPLFLLFAFSETSFGQKFLQLERIHSPKTRKYYPGDEITFQLVNGQWYTRVIEDVSYEQHYVIFAHGHVNVDSILAFRTFDVQKWSRPIGNQLINFAIAWTGFALIAAAVDDQDSYTKGDAGLAVASAGLGYALQKLFRKRTFKMTKNEEGENKKWRLRVLDLTVSKAGSDQIK
ncbi:MAG: hypothetical protein ACE5FF_04270 [Saprospiraceae bacterium]